MFLSLTCPVVSPVSLNGSEVTGVATVQVSPPVAMACPAITQVRASARETAVSLYRTGRTAAGDDSMTRATIASGKGGQVSAETTGSLAGGGGRLTGCSAAR